MIVWRVRVIVRLPSHRHHRSNDDCLEGKRENYQVCSVQYCVQPLYTVQWTDLTVVFLVRFSFSVFLLSVTVYLYKIWLFWIIWCYSLFVYVCFCCVRFSFFSTMPRGWLGRMSVKWPILCRVGRKTLTQLITVTNCSVLWMFFGRLFHRTPTITYVISDVTGVWQWQSSQKRIWQTQEASRSVLLLISIVHSLDTRLIAYHLVITLFSSSHRSISVTYEICVLWTAYVV